MNGIRGYCHPCVGDILLPSQNGMADVDHLKLKRQISHVSQGMGYSIAERMKHLTVTTLRALLERQNDLIQKPIGEV